MTVRDAESTGATQPEGRGGGGGGGGGGDSAVEARATTRKGLETTKVMTSGGARARAEVCVCICVYVVRAGARGEAGESGGLEFRRLRASARPRACDAKGNGRRELWLCRLLRREPSGGGCCRCRSAPVLLNSSVAAVAAASERPPQSAERRAKAERRLLSASDTQCVRGRRRASVPVAPLATGGRTGERNEEVG